LRAVLPRLKPLDATSPLELLLVAHDPVIRDATLQRLLKAIRAPEARACSWAAQLLPAERLSPAGLWVLEQRLPEIQADGRTVLAQAEERRALAEADERRLRAQEEVRRARAEAEARRAQAIAEQERAQAEAVRRKRDRKRRYAAAAFVIGAATGWGYLQVQPTTREPMASQTEVQQSQGALPQALVGAQSNGPIWCAKANTLVEHMICQNPLLARADADLTALYRRRLASSPAAAAKLKATQRAFLLQRNRCADVGCLQQLYQQRFLELNRDSTDP
jgi:hypothetical protein